MADETNHTGARRPKLVRQGGRLWFSKESERRFFFILTVIMMAVGILYRMGVL